MLATLYGITCVMWGVFACQMQIKMWGYSLWRVAVVFVANSLLCPLAITVAVLRARVFG